MKHWQTVLALVSVLILAGCGEVNEDLTDKWPYKELVGREFRSKVELVLYRHSDSRKLIMEEFGPASTFPERSRSEIKPPFPMKSRNKKVFGILPTGTEFRVVKIKDEGNTGMHFIKTYVEITQSSDPQWVGKVVSELGMTTYDRHINLVPKFKPDYMEEIPRTP